MYRFIPSARIATRRATVLPARTLHRSLPALASEVPPNPLSQTVETFTERLQAAPAALKSFTELGVLLNDRGVNPLNPPGKLKLASLMFDSEVRTAYEKMVTECHKAGIDLDPASLQQMAAKFKGEE